MKKGSSFDQMDSPNLSAIDKASFMDGLQLNHSESAHIIPLSVSVSSCLHQFLQCSKPQRGGRDEMRRGDGYVDTPSVAWQPCTYIVT